MTCRLGSVGNVLFVRWQTPQIADIDRIVWEAAKTRQICGKLVVMVCIVPVEMPPPGTDVRQEISSNMKKLLEHCALNILVLEGDGLKRTLMRTVATAIFLLSGDREKSFTVESVDEALQRAEKYINTPPDAIISGARLQGLLS